MATALLTIEGGRIVAAADRYYDHLSPEGDWYRGNGWEVYILPPMNGIQHGTIVCHAERKYSDGAHVCHREFKLADGQLGLAGGYIDDRYAYFRSARFAEWMRRRDITAVKREDPNRVFSGFDNYSGWGTASIEVRTDGTAERRYEDDPEKRGEFNSPGGNPNLWSGTTYFEVSGATWAVVETAQNYRDRHNHAAILYTLSKDIMSLDIPDREVVRETAKAVRELLDPVQGCLDLAVADKAIAKKFPQETLGLEEGRKVRWLDVPAGFWNWGKPPISCYEFGRTERSPERGYLLGLGHDGLPRESIRELNEALGCLGGLPIEVFVKWLDARGYPGIKPERCWFRVEPDLDKREVQVYLARHVWDMRNACLSGNYGRKPVWTIKVP